MLISKKNKIIVKKKIKKLIKKTKFTFKLNFVLEYLKILSILITSKFLIFFQFISLNSIKDLDFYSILLDKNLSYINIKRKILNKLIEKKNINLLKNFNNIISLNNLTDLQNIIKILLNKNILILGYYINKIFFYKKDFNLHILQKNQYLLNILKLKFLIKKIFNKFIFFLKYFLKKIYILLMLKKKILTQI